MTIRIRSLSDEEAREIEAVFRAASAEERVRWLQRSYPPKAPPDRKYMLVLGLSDPDERVRHAAASELGYIENLYDLRWVLLERLQVETSPAVKLPLVFALCRYASEIEISDILIEVLQEEPDEVAEGVYTYLKMCADGAPWPRLGKEVCLAALSRPGLSEEMRRLLTESIHDARRLEGDLPHALPRLEETPKAEASEEERTGEVRLPPAYRPTTEALFSFPSRPTGERRRFAPPLPVVEEQSEASSGDDWENSNGPVEQLAEEPTGRVLLASSEREELTHQVRLSPAEEDLTSQVNLPSPARAANTTYRGVGDKQGVTLEASLQPGEKRLDVTLRFFNRLSSAILLPGRLYRHRESGAVEEVQAPCFVSFAWQTPHQPSLSLELRFPSLLFTCLLDAGCALRVAPGATLEHILSLPLPLQEQDEKRRGPEMERGKTIEMRGVTLRVGYVVLPPSPPRYLFLPDLVRHQQSIALPFPDVIVPVLVPLL